MNRPKKLITLSLLLFILALNTSCGQFKSLADTAGLNDWALGDDTSSSVVENAEFNTSGVRLLSNHEIQLSLRSILGMNDINTTDFLPQQSRTPFDNDINSRQIDANYIDAVDRMSRDIGTRFSASPQLRGAVLPCTPSGANDFSCMQQTVSHLGRLFFRGQMDQAMAEKITNFAIAEATAANNFYLGLELVVELLIKHPLFLFRFENGDLQDGRYRLSPIEMASRLAFTLWGQGPDSALIAKGESNQLQTQQQVVAAAQEMLSDPRATAHMQRFFMMWLFYENPAQEPSLAVAMQNEANNMVARVFNDGQQPWSTLFTLNETTATGQLAEIYGIAGSNGGNWVPFGPNRSGFFSTGAFLSIGKKNGDTSPTIRGKLIRERVLCEKVPSAPPDINVDEPPAAVGGANCKIDRYAAHSQPGTGCFSCHLLMDPIGFGLENFDQFGGLREFENDAAGNANPNCPIDTIGSLDNFGEFSGPAQLAQLALQSGKLKSCMIKNILSFSFGIDVENVNADAVMQTENSFNASGQAMRSLLISIVEADSFMYREGEL